MKATIDIPDALYRQVKARAALDGRAIRDVTIELYTRWLGDLDAIRPPASPGDAMDAVVAMDAWLERWQALGADVRAAAIDPRPVSQIILEERR
jgi:hypothetical protein